ncbi:beta-glucosidase [Butyrivibrio fibrisolvens DSM 3071]|uniref:beta-glucosidase n=1 Tax=Butyrivibrio fibrisolvens DSM 3071 TaxID=1121131 RepID=A0A1M5UXD4_BUTFI|nr:beta-glucosidase BglX [Butyrivibrio fibrisolvens]SHH67655.1 beta-glucosidase [Butyrivibrio fibrisolvens DSM 3071]
MKKSDLLALLKDMSLEEKIMQLVQLPGSTFEEDAAVTGLADDKALKKLKTLAGSTLGLHGTDKLIKIQKEYIENHPHHIPLLFMLDVIHGHKTVLPCPLAQGATFDTDVARNGAAVQARETSADGVHVTFSPMADLVRDARWGRVVESTGEDAYLNGKMTAAMVEGYQGEDIKDIDHIAACVKHFAAYGASEAGRDYNNVELSDYTLRSEYLPAYKEAISAGAKLVMTSFNTLNGIPSSGNNWLMRDILRDEMNFDGVLISDWAAIAEMLNWGFAQDAKDAADKAIEAGVDIDMCTDMYSGNLETLINEGKISEKLIDDAVFRVLSLKNDLGLFEDPYHGASKERFEKVALSDENRKIARDAVRKSLVLLENKNGALPLKKSEKIAFIGPYADNIDLRSSWAISSDPETTVTIKKAAQEVFGKDSDVRFANGCQVVPNDTDLGMFKFHSDTWEEDNDKLVKEALEAADFADTVVMCLGEHVFQSGESTSRTDIRIPSVQKELFDKIKTKGKKLITLIFTGRPLVLDDIPEVSDALMICWRPGTEGGHGIMDVLMGEVSPSGKLPMSFPWSASQEPLYYNCFKTGRPKPLEGLSIFTSRYLDCPNEARYAFGYGLTYSQFEISKCELDKEVLNKSDLSDKITATVTVKNTGDTDAAQILQLYIRDVSGSRVRPLKELRGFKKVFLKAKEETSVSFDITEDLLRFWTIDNKYDSEKGKFEVFIGFDSVLIDDNISSFELM